MLRRLWLWFLAFYHLNDDAICLMSRGRGLHDDFHDYPDDAMGVPSHFVTLRCKRCGKEFAM